MMLNADVRKGGRGLVKCGHLRTGGWGYVKGSFLRMSGVLDLFWGLKPKETINMLVYAGSEANKRKASFNNSCVRNVFKRLGQSFQCRFDPHHSKHKGKNDQQFSYHEG